MKISVCMQINLCNSTKQFVPFVKGTDIISLCMNEAQSLLDWQKIFTFLFLVLFVWILYWETQNKVDIGDNFNHHSQSHDLIVSIFFKFSVLGNHTPIFHPHCFNTCYLPLWIEKFHYTPPLKEESQSINRWLERQSVFWYELPDR